MALAVESVKTHAGAAVTPVSSVLTFFAIDPFRLAAPVPTPPGARDGAADARTSAMRTSAATAPDAGANADVSKCLDTSQAHNTLASSTYAPLADDSRALHGDSDAALSSESGALSPHARSIESGADADHEASSALVPLQQRLLHDASVQLRGCGLADTTAEITDSGETGLGSPATWGTTLNTAQSHLLRAPRFAAAAAARSGGEAAAGAVGCGGGHRVSSQGCVDSTMCGVAPVGTINWADPSFYGLRSVATESACGNGGYGLRSVPSLAVSASRRQQTAPARAPPGGCGAADGADASQQVPCADSAQLQCVPERVHTRAASGMESAELLRVDPLWRGARSNLLAVRSGTPAEATRNTARDDWADTRQLSDSSSDAESDISRVSHESDSLGCTGDAVDAVCHVQVRCSNTRSCHVAYLDVVRPAQRCSLSF